MSTYIYLLYGNVENLEGKRVKEDQNLTTSVVSFCKHF